jgi:hypothetical protein
MARSRVTPGYLSYNRNILDGERSGKRGCGPRLKLMWLASTPWLNACKYDPKPTLGFRNEFATIHTFEDIVATPETGYLQDASGLSD